MPKPDALTISAAAYAAAKWTEQDWRQLGRETGTSDLLTGHPRLYRSLGFGDDDYQDAAEGALRTVLQEGTDRSEGQKGRMELLADFMPDFPAWVAQNAPFRTKRLFEKYIAERPLSDLPSVWTDSHYVTGNNAETHLDLPEESDAAPEPSKIDTRLAAPRPVPAKTSKQIVEEAPMPTPPSDTKPKIFIVHGHDEAAMLRASQHVYSLTGVYPTSLADQAGGGDTIIEKFERIGGEADYAIVVLTGDDVGQTTAAHHEEKEPSPRARQNVILELGYFMGALTRQHVIVLDAGVERPSDIAGLSYVAYSGDWKDDLRKELKHRGLTA